MLNILAFIQVSSAFIGICPFIYYWFKMNRKSKQPIEIPPQPIIWPSLTIVLPLWNEEIVLLKKLEDLEEQQYPSDKIELLVIDSNSTDSTLSILDEWQLNRKSKFKVSVVKMNERKGKSAAINLILQQEIYSDALVITDADALLAPNSLKRIGRWMSDEKIGAVCGTQKIIDSTTTEHLLNEMTYRRFYHDLRIGESSISSTPIFEGSLASYRNSLILGKQIDSTYNADDSQLAILAHRSGGRSIMDSQLTFFESLPTSRKSARNRKLRRANGLVHLFSRNNAKDLDPKFAKIFRNEARAHLLMPFFVMISVFSMLCHFTLSTYYLWLNSNIDDSHIFLLMLDSTIFLLLLVGNQFQLGRVLRSFIISQWILFLANIERYSGKDRRYWDQDIESRKLIANGLD